MNVRYYYDPRKDCFYKRTQTRGGDVRWIEYLSRMDVILPLGPGSAAMCEIGSRVEALELVPRSYVELCYSMK